MALEGLDALFITRVHLIDIGSIVEGSAKAGAKSLLGVYTVTNAHVVFIVGDVRNDLDFSLLLAFDIVSWNIKWCLKEARLALLQSVVLIFFVR